MDLCLGVQTLSTCTIFGQPPNPAGCPLFSSSKSIFSVELSCILPNPSWSWIIRHKAGDDVLPQAGLVGNNDSKSSLITLNNTRININNPTIQSVCSCERILSHSESSQSKYSPLGSIHLWWYRAIPYKSVFLHVINGVSPDANVFQIDWGFCCLKWERRYLRKSDLQRTLWAASWCTQTEVSLTLTADYITYSSLPPRVPSSP